MNIFLMALIHSTGKCMYTSGEMFLCYDIIQDVPRLRSLSLSLAISSKLIPSNNTGATIRGLERTHPDTSCSPSAGSTTRNGVQHENDVDGYSEFTKRVCFGK